jgi:hypothetical protein
MAINFNSDLSDLIGEDTIEFDVDEAVCVIGRIEDGDLELPEDITIEQYKAVVLSFIEALEDISNGDDDDEDDLPEAA